MMKRRILVVAGVALLLLAAFAVWTLREGRDQPTPPGPSGSATTAAPISPLGLRLRVAVGDPAANAMLTLTFFNRASRQAALDRDAPSPARAGQPAATDSVAPIRLDLTAAEWLSRISIDELRADGTTSRINSVAMRNAPAAIALEGAATAVVTLECPAASLPQAGTHIVATFRSDAGPVESDPAVVPAAVPATDALAAAIADARVARISKDTDRLARAAAAIEKAAPESVDAPYYRGLVQEARGEKEAALASYREALARFGKLPRDRNSEPPDELIFLIRRLQGGRQ